MRVPPTEKRGRVHTSSVSVAVVDKLDDSIDIQKSDVKTVYALGTGPGGQHRNKTETCVTLYHYPTQIRVMCQDSRSKHKNEAKAWEELTRRVQELKLQENKSKTYSDRNSQIGLGGRGEKRRTYRVTDGTIEDHITGNKMRLKDWEKGKVEKLH